MYSYNLHFFQMRTTVIKLIINSNQGFPLKGIYKCDNDISDVGFTSCILQMGKQYI
jgi:hypothetical protein